MKSINGVGRRILSRVLSALVYFRRGHATYGAIGIQFTNYVLLLSIFLSQHGIQLSLSLLLAVLTILLYIISMIFLGRHDFRKGQFVKEAYLVARNNPIQLKTIELSLATSLVVAELAKSMGLSEAANKIMRIRSELSREVGLALPECLDDKKEGAMSLADKYRP